MTAEMPLYTNEVTPEFLRTLDKPYFTEQQLYAFDDQALTLVSQQRAYKESHPAIAIYRVATEGSQTRNGGVIQHATGPYEFTLDNGQHVRSASKGDVVVYADGSTAHIVTTSGQSNSYVALVGGHLSNGDEIINTLQEGFLFVTREGVPMPEDFLPMNEGQ